MKKKVLSARQAVEFGLKTNLDPDSFAGQMRKKCDQSATVRTREIFLTGRCYIRNYSRGGEK
jgi:hypothetical protein